MQLDILRTSPNVNATLKSNLDNQFHAKCDLYPKPFDKNKTLKELSLPNIDPSLVILTGLSQGEYLGGKLVTRTLIRIERVVSGISKTLLIFGSNFLTTSGTVIINGNKVYKAQKGIATWADSIIEVSVVDDDTLKSWRTIEIITTEATQARYEREAPCVDYTQLYDGAENVPVDIKPILAVFNEPMKLETFTPDKFTLRTKDGSVTINGNVSYDIGKKTANFNLLEHLCPSTDYIATIDSSVTNEAGIHMEEDEIWSFTTTKRPTPTPTPTP
jgi:hypothetical protein